MQIDSSVEYIFVIDDAGNVIIHSFESNVPSGLKFANIPMNKNEMNTVLLEPNIKHQHLIRDISIPILGGRLGILRVGISEESITSDVMLTINHFWIMVLFFLTTGIIGGFIFAYFITHPIKRIQTVADQLDLKSLKSGEIIKVQIRGKLLNKWKLLFRAEDEIDILAEKFNDMLIRLQEAYSNLEKTRHKLIQSEKLATIGTISSGIAHEINNPIAGMKNCIRRISNNLKNIEQNKTYFKMMDEAIGRMENVVKSLLNFARREDIDFSAVNIEGVIESSQLLLAYRLEQNRISFTKEIDSEIKGVKGSQIHLQQVIINLIINAIDAIEEKGEDSNRFISIKAYNNSNYIVLSIKDGGIGIPEDRIDSIFDPFYTTKEAGRGTGLGLSVVSSIINSHNGKVEVDSEVGKGTEFVVYLPAFIKAQ